MRFSYLLLGFMYTWPSVTVAAGKRKMWQNHAAKKCQKLPNLSLEATSVHKA